MRLPARIGDTARSAETSFVPMSNGFEIIVAIPLFRERDQISAKRLKRTFQYLYVIDYNSIFGINRHAAG
jgi:hypothetical protein